MSATVGATGSEQDLLKRRAAEQAVTLVQSGMVLGLGSGSTMRFALEIIGDRLRCGEIHDLVGIASSLQTERMARQLSIPLTTFETYREIDLTIDGADEVDSRLDLIKGGGGALLREKVLAQASRRNVIIVDETKFSPQLGTRWPVPVEVLPFAWPVEQAFIGTLGARAVLRLTSSGTAFTTDQGNFILDCSFGPISHPERTALQLSQRAGILEHGLFLGLATEVIVAAKDGIRHLRR